MEERDKIVYSKCADTLDSIGVEAKRISLSNLKKATEKITAMCETEKLYLATERNGDDEEDKFEEVDGYFNEIKKSASLILKLPLNKDIIRQYGIKLCSYARQKATIIRDTHLKDKEIFDDWLDRMI